MAKKFWLVIERGSYVATLFVGLVETVSYTHLTLPTTR